MMDYSRREHRVDAAIHALGALGAVIAAVLLLHDIAAAAPLRTHLAATVYGLGLVAVLWLSAAYHLVPGARRKERLRPLDHAAIYFLIAATYTPFGLRALDDPLGQGLFALVWAIAGLGMVLKIVRPRRFERFAVVLYLALGWTELVGLVAITSVIPETALILLGLGAGLFSLGVIFHLWDALPFQNAIWHAFVLAGAGCHYAAVREGLLA